MGWYKFTIQASKVMSGESTDIVNTIGKILELIQGVRRDKIAMFDLMLYDGSLEIYLSPEISKTIKADLPLHNAKPCLDPSLDDDIRLDKLQLVFGNPEVLGNFSKWIK